jgi:hypothetical protein
MDKDCAGPSHEESSPTVPAHHSMVANLETLQEIMSVMVELLGNIAKAWPMSPCKKGQVQGKREEEETNSDFGNDGDNNDDHDESDTEELVKCRNPDVSSEDESTILLQAIDKDLTTEEVYGPPVMPKFTEIVNKRFTNTLTSENIKAKQDKYQLPENFSKLLTPELKQNV